MIVLTQYNIIPLISFLLYGIILFIILTSNRTRLSKSFSMYVVAMMIWSLGSFLMKTDTPPSSLFWNKILQIGFIFVPVLLLRFSYILTDEFDKKNLVKIGYIISVILVILSFMGYVVKDAWYINGEFGYEIGFGAYIFAVVGSLYSIIALAIMIKKTYSKEISLKKVGLVIIGLTLVVLGGALNLNTTIGQYGIDILFNTFNAFLITYAIYRSKFLEINLVVKRGLSISVYNIVLFIIYAFIVIFSYNFFSSELGITNLTTVVFLMSPVFFLLEPIRIQLMKLTRHVFYRGTTDRQIVLKQ